MNKSIELSSFVHHEKDLNKDSSKMELKQLNKYKEFKRNEMVKFLIIGIIFLILFIIFSIVVINYILQPEQIIFKNIIKDEEKNLPNISNQNQDKNDNKENYENKKPLDKNKEEINDEKPKKDEKPKESEKPKEKEKIKVEENERLEEKEKTKEEENKSKEKEKPKDIEKPNIEKPKENSDPRCNQIDPIYMFSKRLEAKPIILGQNGDSKHICYQDNNRLFRLKNGVFCKMENIVLDPSKWRDTSLIYHGPVDFKDRGCPLLSKGFFNMKANNANSNFGKRIEAYKYYFNGWNYDYNDNDDNTLEELAPGKIIFFLSRNQDTPNLFHGGSEFINALSLIYLLKLDPKDIQVIYLESLEIKINNDPFYELYKNLVSRGGEPFHIRTLKKKYHISSAIHIPVNWDSPCFIDVPLPTCQYPTLLYKYFNDLISHYMDIKHYQDSFVSDNEYFYYPKSVIEHHKAGKSFKKIITFQWRRVWPRGRVGQNRILGNGPEVAEKLSKFLPEDYLIRLIDNSALSMTEQISLMLDTDYFIGVHGAGLYLIIFAPSHCILHEVLAKANMNWLLLMGSLSGHRYYSDIIKADTKKIEGSEYIFFNEDAFANTILQRMKSSGFI